MSLVSADMSLVRGRALHAPSHPSRVVGMGSFPQTLQHVRSGLAHALVGSVAEWVIASAPCDVLVARPRSFTFELP
jgi:nucleotide-binding universal stress UspA family protein